MPMHNTQSTPDVVAHDPSILILALGNRLRGDDGVGPVLAEKVGALLPECKIVAGIDDAMSIVNTWQDSRLTIVLDAAHSGDVPGTLHRLEGDVALPARDLMRCSSHGSGLADALELGRIMKRFPEKLVIFAIEAESFNPGDQLSESVSCTVPAVVDNIVAEIQAYGTLKNVPAQ